MYTRGVCKSGMYFEGLVYATVSSIRVLSPPPSGHSAHLHPGTFLTSSGYFSHLIRVLSPPPSGHSTTSNRVDLTLLLLPNNKHGSSCFQEQKTIHVFPYLHINRQQMVSSSCACLCEQIIRFIRQYPSG